MHRRAFLWIMTVAALVWPARAEVKLWQETITLPTYLAGDPEPNPMFFFGRQSQGAQGPVYPYPMYDTLTGKKVDKVYTAVYLENEYIRIGVLPEIGGRIFEGVDKTNGYNFIYRQHVIKPALIGLIGAWISGGLEWNIPHHHRATTFIPVQYRTEEHADGSKTIWVGELEVRQRMRWAVGYTLHPGKAYLEASVRILNRTPVANSMLCFANLAVHANENYQVIFPPGTQYGVFHGKREFTAWPFSTSVYAGADFTRGVDISWYKNHIQANSVFAWNYQDDFFAGYDHGKQAGTMSVADHHIVPGKKFWTWGNGPDGRTWDKILTDDDGPYIELMTGAYSDNQPDYSWLEPYETRSFVLHWYPFRDIGGAKKANLEAAVNLEVAAGAVKLGFYTTAAHSAARVRLAARGKALLEDTVAIDPSRPYVRQVPLPAGVNERDLVASIGAEGRELLSYRPAPREPEPMPKPVTTPAAPRDIKATEELYLIGLRAQQFHDPAIDPAAYWEEALRRDPGDTRVHTVLGVADFRAARYAAAEQHLRRALERLADRYTSPKDGEALYYLGATLQAEGKTDEAYSVLYKAAWSEAWKAPAYFALAEIAAGREDFQAALDLVGRSLDGAAIDVRARNLQAAALRHLGRTEEALQAARAARHIDPLDVRAMAEEWLASRRPDDAREMTDAMSSHPATAQETAAEYLEAGLWQDGTDVLRQTVASAPEVSKIHPMVYYYLGYFAGKLGQPRQESEYGRLAMSMPPDYVFPFQSEAMEVLRAAMRSNPRDARAAYYLGNVLYDRQPEEAIRAWETSAAIDPAFAITHRNLAIAYQHRKPRPDLDRAIAEMEKAVSADRKYALHFAELDELYRQAGVPLERRVPIFRRNAAVVAQRDDAENRAIALQIAMGEYDDAIRAMSGKRFAAAEGENLNVSEHWTDAHLLRARKYIEARRYQDALADLAAAATIPANLPPQSAGEAAARRAEIAWWTGTAYGGMGSHEKAVAAWRAVEAPAPAGTRRRSAAANHLSATRDYYRALCLAKLGKPDKAREIFSELLENGKTVLSAGETARESAAEGHYLLGLGYLGLHDLSKAKDELSRAVELSPDLLSARTALGTL